MRLEKLLGDLDDPANPTGAAAILAADERGEMLTAGEAVLDEYCLNAEFVPAALGGRLDDLERLVEVMRTVYRRDPVLGLGYGASSLISGVLLWTAGSPAQKEKAAKRLLSGERIAVAVHELAHGNDMAGMELAATPAADGWLLNGRKEVVTNIQRAQAVVVFARTDPKPGPRSHTLMFVERAPGDGTADLPRFATSGMRGLQLGGLAYDDTPAVALGPVGSGLEQALRALQVTRTVLPAMATGVLDTGLRLAITHLSRRKLYGGKAIDLPHVRSVLAGVFADLLKAEAISAAGTRALHVVPGSTAVYSSAVKFAVSKLVLDGMDRLSELLGAHFYLREGPVALFQKLLRDLAPVGFGHIARAACQMSLLPQLPLLARRSWRTEAEPTGLFRGDLPELRFDRLALHAAGQDPLAASLAAALQDNGIPRDVRATAEANLADLTGLAEICARLPIAELGVDAPSRYYDLVTRYVGLLVRISCLQLWRHSADGFLADPAWLSSPDALLAELLDRHRDHRYFGLSGRRLA
ncbi:acyl-CoA dehydrogenase family protein [Lentzea sp. NPDC004782]|uniref:acyl-CoA dehydrogenase family protein n=1 Tax=Lentzea sp. NPDC004782 TaxID=3154458 RepID=UPI0033BD0395